MRAQASRRAATLRGCASQYTPGDADENNARVDVAVTAHMHNTEVFEKVVRVCPSTATVLLTTADIN